MLLVARTYALGTLLFTRSVGVAAALLLTVQTQVFAVGSELLPDLFAAALVTVAAAMAVAVRRGRVRRWRAAMALVGLLLGWSYRSASSSSWSGCSACGGWGGGEWHGWRPR